MAAFPFPSILQPPCGQNHPREHIQRTFSEEGISRSRGQKRCEEKGFKNNSILPLFE